MICPVCRKELVKGKDERYETLEEHVSDPNGTPSVKETFRCPDENCRINKKFEGFWDWYGDFYSHEYCPGEDFIALDSHRKQADVEISKRDENFTFFRTYSWKFRIVFKYKANTMGEVVKRTPTIEIQKRHWDSFKDYFTWYFQNKDKRSWPSWCLHHTNYRMYKFCLKEFYKLLAELYCSYENDSWEEIYKWLEKVENKLDDLRQKSTWGKKGKYKFLVKWDWYRRASYKKAYKEYMDIDLPLKYKLKNGVESVIGGKV